jgi:iron complex transport system permease protein
MTRNILLYVRLPRVCGSLLCGGALAVSGAVIQGVLANRLASPGIIGVNAGAGLAVTLCAALGVVGGWQVSFLAFLGALIAMIPISLLAQRWGASRGTILLLGVALNSLLGACSDAVTALSPEVSVMSADFKIGDFSSVTYNGLLPAVVIIALAILAACLLAHTLDALSLGEEHARALGVNTNLSRIVLLILAALMAGASVSLAGLLSFVGLLVPHAVRRLAGNQARHLLPLCALLGAGFVTLCDTLSRILFAPYQLPVGILLAFLGAPFFIWILLQRKGGQSHAGM